MLIREALEADIPVISEIYNHVIRNTTAVYQYNEQTLEMRYAWFEMKRKEKWPVWVAEEEGRVIGFASYGPYRPWAAYKYTVENMIHVAEDQRGKGVARLLMQELIYTARKEGYHTIMSGIDAANEASIRLHARFGFKEVGLFRQVGFKFGRWLDLTFMQLVLDTPANPVDGEGVR